MSYAAFKNSVIGQQIGDGECVSLVVNNSRAYAEYLFPGVSWPAIFAPVSGAKDLWNSVNTQYFQKIANDTSNSSQLPEQGDVMVFDATPKAGYSNTFANPYGHTGICESADDSGYNLLQQNAPASGQVANVTNYPWRYRPCIGWLRPIPQTPPAPVIPMITLDELTEVFQNLLHRAPDVDAIAHYVGHYTYDFVVNDVSNSAERKQLLANEAATPPPATPVEPSKPPTPSVTPPAVSQPEAPAQDNPPEKAPSTPPALPTQKPAPKLTSFPVPEKKVVVVDPTYYKVWELIIAILKKIFNKK